MEKNEHAFKIQPKMVKLKHDLPKILSFRCQINSWMYDIYIHPEVQASHNHIHKKPQKLILFGLRWRGSKKKSITIPPTIECTKILGKI